MLSKIVYDVKFLNGGELPKINLIGHSRGGLTNLQYALDHPDLVAGLYSMGTPYFGTDTGSTDVGAGVIGGMSHGLQAFEVSYLLSPAMRSVVPISFSCDSTSPLTALAPPTR